MFRAVRRSTPLKAVASGAIMTSALAFWAAAGCSIFCFAHHLLGAGVRDCLAPTGVALVASGNVGFEVSATRFGRLFMLGRNAELAAAMAPDGGDGHVGTG